MTPPELAADAPILNVLQPMLVNRFPTLRAKMNRTIRANRGTRFFHLGILQEPLLAQAGLDRHAGPLAESNRAFMRFFLRQKPALREQLGRFLARHKAIEAVELRNTGTIDPAVGMQDVDHRQAVPLTDLEVDFVMRRGHFQNAGAEFRIDPRIAD